jgi:hypothetical protein
VKRCRAWITLGRTRSLQLAGAVRSRLSVLKKRFPLAVEGLILLLTVSVVTVWLLLELRLQIVQHSLPAARIMPDKGNAYIVKIARAGLPYITEIAADAGDAPRASSLELYEDGKLLGPPHWSRDNVRDAGRGTFSHRRRGLYFSTSDNSSPLTNGRRYEIRSPLSATSFARWLGITALLIIPWRIFVCLPRVLQSAFLTRGRRILQWAVAPAHFGQNWLLWAVLALALVGASWYYLFALWGSSDTVNLAVGGFFQVSDSSGYAACANHVLDEGVSRLRTAEYFTGWCLRRPTYSMFLASVLSITGRDWLWTLLVQSAFVALSMTVLFRAVARLAGPVTALLVLCIMFSFAANNVYPVTLTENIGLALGAVGLAFLLDAERLAEKRLLFLGSACLSTALNARAGAFFALPFLVAAFLFQAIPWRSRWLSSAIVFAGIASGFVLHSVLIAHFGGPAGASHSNFSHTLYGLSLGGKGWSQVYTDHPELFLAHSEAEAGRRVIDLAVNNIISTPLLFTKALTRNFFDYLRGQALGPTSLRLFWWVGALAIVLRWRDTPYRMLGYISVGVLLSAPFIIQDGGPRVFAATWGITGLQMGVGLHLILRFLKRIVDDSRALDDSRHFRPHALDVAVAACLIAAILLPATPFRGFAALKPVPALGCQADEKELIARLGHESYMIVLVGDDQHKSFWRLQVSTKNLLKNIGGNWFDKDFAALPMPTTLINGYQTMAGNIGDDIRLAWHGDLGEFFGKTVSLCYRTDSSVSVADNPYYPAVSVRPIAP